MKKFWLILAFGICAKADASNCRYTINDLNYTPYELELQGANTIVSATTERATGQRLAHYRMKPNYPMMAYVTEYQASVLAAANPDNSIPFLPKSYGMKRLADGQRVHEVGFIEGTTIETALNKAAADRKLPYAQRIKNVLNIFRDTLVELGKLHKLGVVHGDAKAANILRDPQGQIVFIDLGGAKVTLRNGTVMIPKIVLADPLYRAPETFTSRPESLTPKADNYAISRNVLDVLKWEFAHNNAKVPPEQWAAREKFYAQIVGKLAPLISKAPEGRPDDPVALVDELLNEFAGAHLPD